MKDTYSQKRAIALLTCLIFLWTNFFWSAPPSYAAFDNAGPAELPDFTQLKLPAELGSIQEFVPQSPGASLPFVIYIQDAHAVYDAQRSIQGIIHYLQKSFRLPLVAVEGAAGPLDPVLFRTFPDEKVKEKVFDELMHQGEISGAEAAAILNPLWSDFVGIEDKELYLRDRDAFIKALEVKAQVEQELGKRLDFNREQKAKSYSPELLLWDQKTEAFEANPDELTHFLEWIADSEIPVKEYPKLRLLTEEVSRERKQEAHEKGYSEIRLKKLAGEVKARLSRAELEGYHSLEAVSRQSDRRKDFLIYLRKKAREKGVSLEPYRVFFEEEKKRLKLRALAGDDFFQELHRFIRERKESLFRSDEERALDREARELKLLRKLASLEITREELAEIKDFASRLAAGGPHQTSTAHPGHAGREVFSSPLNLLDPAFKFYELALKRDRVLFENLAREIRAKKAPFAAAVTGGFHTEGMKALLKEKGYGCLVIAPRINEVGESPYLDVMLQKNPSYAKYLKKNPAATSQIAPMVLLSREMLGPEMSNAVVEAWVRRLVERGAKEDATDLERLFRTWHDAIIKFLIESGSGSDSSEYLKILEEVHRGFASLDVSTGLTRPQAIRAVIGILESFVRKNSHPGQIRAGVQKFFERVSGEFQKDQDAERAVRTALKEVFN